MRKSYTEIAIVCLVFVAGAAHAQKFRFSGYGSYVLDGTYNIYYVNGDFHEGRISHGLQSGIGIEYMVSPKYGIEFSSFSRNTSVTQVNGTNSDKINASLGFKYFLIGINAYQTHSPKFQSYGGVSTGVIMQYGNNNNAIMSNTLNRTITKFTWTARLGEVFWLSWQVGLKVQAQWLSSLQFKGNTSYDVYRANIGPMDYSIVNQFEVGSGVIIKLEKPDKK